ncbi:hypothetical protein [Embleya sp. NPDC005575]|uniref:hypothetical protein n=1 Tax=Embleya sp. NPDC005575 TaxID=3156892 RepID=UPI0033A2FD00
MGPFEHSDVSEFVPDHRETLCRRARAATAAADSAHASGAWAPGPGEHRLAIDVWRVLTGPPVPDAPREPSGNEPLIWWSLTHATTIAATVPILIEHASDVPPTSPLLPALTATATAHNAFGDIGRAFDQHMGRRPANYPPDTWEQTYMAPSGPVYELVRELYAAQSALTMLCYSLAQSAL